MYDLCSGVVYFVQQLRSSFAACCSLGLMMWFIISKEISRNWDQAAILQKTLQESCRINLKASFIFQIVFISLHFSLSFFSFSHFTFLVSWDVRKQWKSTRNLESPACPDKGRKCQEVSRCSQLWCLLIGWEWATAYKVIVVALEYLVELGFLLPEGWKLH